MSSVSCLKKVLALYPHEPLPSHYFHAPILPKYSKELELEEEVILGLKKEIYFLFFKLFYFSFFIFLFFIFIISILFFYFLFNKVVIKEQCLDFLADLLTKESLFFEFSIFWKNQVSFSKKNVLPLSQKILENYPLQKKLISIVIDWI